MGGPVRTGQPSLVTALRRFTRPLPAFPRAVCVARTDLTWLPDDETSRDAKAAATACCGCPHVAACAAWAIATPTVVGIWGGLTSEQRAALRDAAR